MINRKPVLCCVARRSVAAFYPGKSPFSKHLQPGMNIILLNEGAGFLLADLLIPFSFFLNYLLLSFRPLL
jgi:hypothetical protein